MNDRCDSQKAFSNIHIHSNNDSVCWLHQPALRAGRASTHRVRSWPPSERESTAVHVLASAYRPRYVPLQVAPRLFWVLGHPSKLVVRKDPLSRRPQRGTTVIGSRGAGMRSTGPRYRPPLAPSYRKLHASERRNEQSTADNYALAHAHLA